MKALQHPSTGRSARSRGSALAMAIRALVVGEMILFFLAAVMHLGVRIPLGFGVLAFPVAILPATIAETLIGLGFLAALVVLLTRPNRAWGVAVGAHVFALLGTLLGLAVGPQAGPDRVVHYIMLVAAVGGLVVLATPPARAALGRIGR